ncbi:hypothetical protein Ocin01_10079 [Orchesella cincta]|uniref:Transmembrane protein n=1 Tax=Orchesella cincta TaxID=48709 RepID=A0A1D2MV53_ORCCI|nr:hypothetical protein Ocin01_10079 [Orchesella cincta]
MGQRKYHPTCHLLSLTMTTKIVALFDMVFGLFGLVWFVLMLSRFGIISLDPFENADTGAANQTDRLDNLRNTDQHTPDKQAFATNHKVINLTLVAFYTAVNLVFFIILLVGVHKRSPGICLIWFHIRCAIFVFKAIILVMYLIGGRPLYSQIPFILSMLAHLYGLWVVNCYVEELRGNIFEKRLEETKTKNEQAVIENSNITDDIPNGIEQIQKKRMQEGLDNPLFHTGENEENKEKSQE